MKPNVLVTEPIHPNAIAFLEEHADVTVGKRGQWDTESALINGLSPYSAALTMLSNPVTANVLESNKQLKIVANYAVGYNNIDVEAAKKLGIKVSNTPDVLSEATADIALSLLLSVARRTHEAENSLRNGEFDGWHPAGFVGLELFGKKAAIIGMGRIGKAIARRLGGFGIDVHYHNRSKVNPAVEKILGATYNEDLESLLKSSHFIFLSCPLTPQTYHLLNKDRLNILRSDAIIVNTGRGPLIDEAELANVLHYSKIAGAGLDVFEKEPIVHPDLLTAPNAVLLPHIGSATKETRRKMGLLAAQAIVGILQEKPASEIPNLIF